MDKKARTGSRRLLVHTGFLTGMLALALVRVVSPAVADAPMTPPSCALRLSVEVTPDVPDPTSGAFLSSLLGDHAGYQLFLLSRDDNTHVSLQLQGPGPVERCRNVVSFMRNDGRIQSIQET